MLRSGNRWMRVFQKWFYDERKAFGWFEDGPDGIGAFGHLVNLQRLGKFP